MSWQATLHSGGGLPALPTPNSEASEIVIHFKHADELKTVDGSTAVKGFVIADATQHWQWAEARIKDRHVMVSHPGIQQPVAVRYAWANNPKVNLVSVTGLPAAPFRTADWPMDNASLPPKPGASQP